jgi:hypothetical protein
MMRKIFGLSAVAGVAAGIAIVAVRGCDDGFDGGPLAKLTGHGNAQVARLGPGWRATADAKISAWAFLPVPADGAAPPRPDALAAIRAALEANMLPPHDMVQIADLVDRALPAAAPADPAADPQVPQTLLTTSPWNDDTLLLWVEVPGTVVPAGQAVSVEFDSKTVAAYRPLGDAQALPRPDGATGRVAMLYELSVPEDDRPHPNRRFGVLHIGAGRHGDSGEAPAPKQDIPITDAGFTDNIDGAPATVRFAAAIAGFAELLRGDPAVRDLSCSDVINLAEGAGEPDPDGTHAQMIALMRRAQPLIDLPPADTPLAQPATAEGDAK